LFLSAGAFKVLGLMQPLKDPEQLVRVLHVEPDAVVPHEQDDTSTFFACAADRDRRRVAHPAIFDSVADEVGEHLLEQGRVSDDRRQGGYLPHDGAAVGRHFQTADDILHQRIQLDRHSPDLGPAQAGEVQ